MYVDERDGFFVFDPTMILSVSTENTRGYSESEIMENFPFDIGSEIFGKERVHKIQWEKPNRIDKNQSRLFGDSSE